MPLYMDVHNVGQKLNAKEVAEAHMKDVAIQDQHGVKYVNYWVDEAAGKIYCLAEAPNAEAAIRVHREAHGMLADEIHEVVQGV